MFEFNDEFLLLMAQKCEALVFDSVGDKHGKASKRMLRKNKTSLEA